MAWNLHAIEQTQSRGRRRVDGVGRLKFDSHTGNKFWKRCCKIRQKLKKTKGREPLGVYKDILDQMARADQEIAEAEMLELEAAAAADQHLVDQAGDESDDLDMEELLDDVGMNEEKPKVRDAAWKRQ